MFLATLWLIAMLYSRIHWLLKASLIVLSLGFAALFYHSYVSAMGYPIATSPPPQFEVLAAAVHEPFPSRNDYGAIYLWITDLSGKAVPRAIQLPYTNELRKKATEAEMRAQDQRVFMGVTKPKQPGDSKVPYPVNHPPTLEFKAPPDTVPKKG